MYDLETLRALHQAEQKLEAKIDAKEREYDEADVMVPSPRRERRLTKIAAEIESLRNRLETTQNLIEKCSQEGVS